MREGCGFRRGRGRSNHINAVDARREDKCARTAEFSLSAIRGERTANLPLSGGETRRGSYCTALYSTRLCTKVCLSDSGLVC